MTSTFFVDTNVLIYAQDSRSPTKQKAAATWLRALAEREVIVVNPQVISEYCHVIRRRFKTRSADELRVFVGLMRPWCSAPASYEVAARGLELHFDTGYQIFDCNLIAAALWAGCQTFLSEDMQQGHRIEGLRIINPFEVAPDAAFFAN